MEGTPLSNAREWLAENPSETATTASLSTAQTEALMK